MKKLLYVTSSDPANRKSWSGVLFSLNRELSKYFEVDNIIVPAIPPLGFKIINKISKTISGKGQSYSHSIARAKKNSKKLNEYLKNKKYDAIFAIDAASLAFVETDIPIVYYSDGIASKMIDYYWFNMTKKAVYEANYVQRKALENSTKCIFTNNWARMGAIDDYSISPNKLNIVHTGANIENDEVVRIEHDNINLLFCGVDWVRKGGDVAVGTLRELTKMDKTRKYVLHMYGCKPPYEIIDENIILHGFLNRDIPEQRAIFERLWGEADFFISPLLADCAAASFCEACAYSVPSVTYDTGGIGDHVINDYNGYRLHEGATPKEFAEVILKWINTPGMLETLKKNARYLYETDLNWVEAGKQIRDIIECC